jgi:hypothetical protein
MKRNEYNTINGAYMNIINESRPRWLIDNVKLVTRNNPTVEQIKEALLRLAKMDDWTEFVNSQRTGECALIAQSVSRMFPKMKFYSVIVNFSEYAISKMEPQDDPDMFRCTHYLNMFKDQYFDFGKATNRYEGVYVLDGIDNMYSCIYSQDAVNYIKEPILRDPKVPGIYLR